MKSLSKKSSILNKLITVLLLLTIIMNFWIVVSVSANDGVNLALGKSVTASSYYGNDAQYQPSKANDDNTTTAWVRWSAQDSGVASWWKVDLQDYYLFDKIEIVSRSNGIAEERRNFAVQGSNDENFSSYVVLYSQNSTPFDGTLVITPTDTNCYRYLRVIKTAITETIGISEFRAYGTKSIYGPNIALGKTAKASSYYANDAQYQPSKANDGLTSTAWARWGSADSGIASWWQVDLQKIYKINRIEVVPRVGQSNQERRSFKILASNDENFGTYATLYTKDATDLGDGVTIAITSIDTSGYRYIKLIKTSTTETMGISELRVFGDVSLKGPNLALGKLATASSYYSNDAQYQPLKANDGSDTTGWARWSSVDITNKIPAWWQVDLQQNYILSEINIVPRTGQPTDQERRNFKILASNDATFTTFDVIYEQGTSFPDGQTLSANIQSKGLYRYIRLAKIDYNETIGIAEFRVYGSTTTDSYYFAPATLNMETLVPQTDLSANAVLCNYDGNTRSIVMILALYDENGTKVKEVDFAQGTGTGIITVPLNATITLPENVAGLTAKVFVWNSLEYMTPFN